MSTLCMHAYLHFWQPMPEVIYEVNNDILIPIILVAQMSSMVFQMLGMKEFDMMEF